jgi:hypothetical protein
VRIPDQRGAILVTCGEQLAVRRPSDRSRETAPAAPELPCTHPAVPVPEAGDAVLIGGREHPSVRRPGKPVSVASAGWAGVERSAATAPTQTERRPAMAGETKETRQ